MSRRSLFMVLALAAVSACTCRNVSCRAPAPAEPPDASTLSMERPIEDPGGGSLVIVALGDSLTAGLGLLSQQAYPVLIEEMFAAEGYHEVEVVNAGVSGDTTAGGLRRVEALLTPNVRILLVALGGNDALRGLTVRQTHDNLAGIIDVALAHQVDVLLAGMEAPTNLGQDYQDAFRGAFQQVFSEYSGSISMMPFLLEGVAAVPALNQPDGIHPNADGARTIAESLYPRLRTMVDRLGVGGGGE